MTMTKLLRPKYTRISFYSIVSKCFTRFNAQTIHIMVMLFYLNGFFGGRNFEWIE